MEENLIDLHASHKSIRASEEAVKLLDLEYKADVPYPNEGWKSANQLIGQYKGSASEITNKLANMEMALVNVIIDQTDLTEFIARDIVNRHLLGRRRPAEGGCIALYASPLIMQLLERDGMFCAR